MSFHGMCLGPIRTTTVGGGMGALSSPPSIKVPFYAQISSLITFDEAQAIKFDMLGSKVEFPQEPMIVKFIGEFNFFDLSVKRLYCEVPRIGKFKWVIQFQYEKDTDNLMDTILFHTAEERILKTAEEKDMFLDSNTGIVGARELIMFDDSITYTRAFDSDKDRIAPETFHEKRSLKPSIENYQSELIRVSLMVYNRRMLHDVEELLIPTVNLRKDGYLEALMYVGVVVPSFSLKVI